MRNQTTRRGLVGSFADPGTLLAAATRARELGIQIAEVYSPIPVPALDDLRTRRPSKVRFATLLGAVTGLASGLALAIWSSVQWNLIVGGKPVTSIVPFLVVGFEFTILFGGLATLAALLVLARLPVRTFPSPGFRPEFSNDRFGLYLEVDPQRAASATELLRAAGALEVLELDGDASGKGVGP